MKIKEMSWEIAIRKMNNDNNNESRKGLYIHINR